MAQEAGKSVKKTQKQINQLIQQLSLIQTKLNEVQKQALEARQATLLKPSDRIQVNVRGTFFCTSFGTLRTNINEYSQCQFTKNKKTILIELTEPFAQYNDANQLVGFTEPNEPLFIDADPVMFTSILDALFRKKFVFSETEENDLYFLKTLQAECHALALIRFSNELEHSIRQAEEKQREAEKLKTEEKLKREILIGVNESECRCYGDKYKTGMDAIRELQKIDWKISKIIEGSEGHPLVVLNK
jgi:hypothetical protein